MVAFANTRLDARELVFGLRERGDVSEGASWNYNKGKGHVRAKAGQYTRAIDDHGVDVRLCLVEAPGGGLGPEMVGLLKECAEQRGNKLDKHEYDDTTWAARSWMSFNIQKLSVAIHRTLALELARALGLSRGADPRGAQE